MKKLNTNVQGTGVELQLVEQSSKPVIGAYFDAQDHLLESWLNTLVKDGRFDQLLDLDEGTVAEFADRFIGKVLTNTGKIKTELGPEKELLFCFQQNGQVQKMVTVSASSQAEANRKMEEGKHLDTQSKTEWFDGYRPYSVSKVVNGRMVEYRHTKNGMMEV